MDGSALAKVAVFMGIVCVGAALLWWLLPSQEAPPVPENFFEDPSLIEAPPTISPADQQEPELMFIHVAGEVRNPGLIRLPEGARVADALESAGGATAEANLSDINLAAQVHDGEQILVPQVGQSVPSLAEPMSPAGVHVNTATAADLETLPGIGPVMAERIIAFREENGPFARIEDLQAVSGIGPVLLERLRHEVTL